MTNVDGNTVVIADDVRITPAATGSSPMAAAAAELRRTCGAADIDAATLTSILRSQGRSDLLEAVAYVFTTRHLGRLQPRGGDATDRSGDDVPVAPPARRTMAALMGAVEDNFAVTVDFDLCSPVRKVLRKVRDVGAGLILAMCVWLVLGSIVTRQNKLAHEYSPLVALIVLLVCLSVLALLEAAHIAAVALSTADVTQLRDTHHRVWRLHPFIATKERLERYLEGRQAGVVLVVFGIAEVTRTAGMITLPGTGIALPKILDLPMTIGVPGALMVLVIGQVAPQLVAARTPAAMMNTIPMAVAFRATLLFASIGLARPANWFVAPFRGQERIPSADRERFIAETMDVTGYAMKTLRHEVNVGHVGSTSLTATATSFTATGASAHEVVLATTAGAPTSTSARASLKRDEVMYPVVVKDDSAAFAPDGEVHRFAETYAPRMGTFEAGDTIHTVFAATYDERLTIDRIVVTAPTQVVVLRAVLEHPPVPLPAARLTVIHPGNNVGSNEAASSTSLAPLLNDEDKCVEFVAVLRYPVVGSVITLDWSVEF